MATLDEIFASMPEEAAEGVHDLLIIDPEARTIDVPETESIFGVENDGRAETKYFKAPRYVGNGIDLAACFLRVNFQNANGDKDAHLVNDLAISGEHVLFSWELSKKVTQYKGAVQFVLCANLPGSTKVADWHTTLTQGTVLEGLEPDAAAVEAASSDIIAQLLALVTSQTEAVEAAGAAQVANVQTEGAAQVDAVKAAAGQAEADALAEIEAKKQNTLAQLPADYTTLGNQVDKLTRSTAGAIVCEAAGETIQVHDASDNYLAGLRVFGKSTQDSTPTPDNPVEIVSTPAPVITVTDGTENNVQTLAITTPGNLPGIPVSSGGNYTDANGQQWVCDEVDLARGVYVQRVNIVSLDGANGAREERNNGTHRFAFSAILNPDYLPARSIDNEYPALCTALTPSFNVLGYNDADNTITAYIFGGVYIRCDKYETVEDLVAWAEGIGLRFAYILAEPIERPLSEEELAAWRNMHSVKPTTTILNDAGAHMAVEYVADTKLYIDRKLAEILTAKDT